MSDSCAKKTCLKSLMVLLFINKHVYFHCVLSFPLRPLLQNFSIAYFRPTALNVKAIYMFMLPAKLEPPVGISSVAEKVCPIIAKQSQNHVIDILTLQFENFDIRSAVSFKLNNFTSLNFK